MQKATQQLGNTGTLRTTRRDIARAWITKPFQPSTLVDAVNKLCV